MFKSKSSHSSNKSESSTKNKSNGNAKASSTTKTNGNGVPEGESPISVSVNGVDEVEPGKEAKEKKSWVKTIGIRTLRMRRNNESRSSRLSLPAFSSLDRPGKSKKLGKAEESPPDEDMQLQMALNNSFSQSSANSSIRIHQLPSTPSTVNGGRESANNANKTTNAAGATNAIPVPGENSNSEKHDPTRFVGEGLSFKGKLIGVLEVSGPRGDRICQEALSELKMAVKAAGEHKQKVTVHVALDGLRIRDEKNGDCLYHHQVHKISFIAQDLTDTRAFGYIFGHPDTGHRFFGIKTEKSASQVVIAMRDLFQVVFDLKKKEIEKAKQQLEMQQKFLATRAAEIGPNKGKLETKSSIAETYIEGACANSSTIIPPNRTAPEVDLLNLEVELTSLQEGLESIHHNFVHSQGQGSSSTFRGSTNSISSSGPSLKRPSSSNAHMAHMTSSDPFGDSFVDPFVNESKFADPFSGVDPFPKIGGEDQDFFNSDPFESPSGPFSFSFPPPETNPNEIGIGRRKSSSPVVRDRDPPPLTMGMSNEVGKVREGWTASFEDNFVPESSQSKSNPKPIDLDMFFELDPLKRPSNDFKSSETFDDKKSTNNTNNLKRNGALRRRQSSIDANTGLPNSFSTNFGDPNRSESPPNYSPPPPPRGASSSPRNTQLNHQLNPPPASASPRMKKKLPALKQMSISNSNDPPKYSSPRALGKQFTLDSSFKSTPSSSAQVPSLSPPPRPPHGGGAGSSATLSSTSTNRSFRSSSAVPRPSSGDKNKINAGAIAPEPPPRPLQSTLPPPQTSQQSLVSPPPPLPPKKQTTPGFSTPMALNQNQKPTNTPVKYSSSTKSEANDLPLPLPLRKLHATNSTTSERYAFPPPASEETKELEAALAQVASLSLRDLATALELPVERLSSYTIQQLAVQLTEKGKDRRQRKESINSTHSAKSANSTNSFHSTSSRADFNSSLGFEDDFSTASAPAGPIASAPSVDRYAVFRELAVEDASGFSIAANADSQEELSNTLQLELDIRESSSERTLQADLEPEERSLKSESVSFAAPMANTLDDVTDVNLSDDDEQDNDNDEIDDFVKSEWATFESAFDDQFATTALVKAEESLGEDSSDEVKVQEQVEQVLPVVIPERKRSEDEIKSSFTRQSSGSSKHSVGKHSDYSDSGATRERDRDRDRERVGSGRRRDYERYDYYRDRPDSRSSYASLSRGGKHRDSEEEYSQSHGPRRRSGGSSSARRYEPDDEEEEVRYATRRHSRRHHAHHSGRERRRTSSPDRYSGHESECGSCEEEYASSSSRRRDRESYAREREYYERHHRPVRPSGSGRYSRESPRDPYYHGHGRRGESYRDRRRYDDYVDSREVSEYSGEEEGGYSYRDGRGHGHGHKRMRAKRSREKEANKEIKKSAYYTNSPSYDSESGPEEGSTRRPNSSKDRDRDPRNLRSPEQQRDRRSSKNSPKSPNPNKSSPKSPKFNFDDDANFYTGKSSPLDIDKVVEDLNQLSARDSPINVPITNGATENLNSGTKSPFENDFVDKSDESKNGIENLNSYAEASESFLSAEAPNSNVKAFPYSAGGRRLESIKSEEEKSNDDSGGANGSGAKGVEMKKSDSFNIFKQRADDPFADDDFFA